MNRWNVGILTIRNQSVSNSECARVCGLKTVAEVSKKGRCYPTIISGRPRVTIPHQDRYLVISARRQRGSTARALGSALTVATGIRISRQTAYRRLNHAGLYTRRPAICIYLTSAQQRARFNWNLTLQHWSVEEWDNVMFSDESRFNLSSDSRRAGIMMYGRTNFHFFDTGCATAQRYRHEVLQPHVRLFRGAVCPDFICMDDIAPCHQAVQMDDFLETETSSACRGLRTPLI
ncbi:transposable element Tcb2 transposase [Trichonephila clavipes]|nr:transposable element Tcb2 transposase [Trichonephila clavipes]